MSFRKTAVCFLALAAIATGAFPQVTPAAGVTPPDDTPKVNVGVTIFGDYTYTDSPTSKDSDGNVIGEKRFLGLFSSAAYRTSVRDLPELDQRVRRLVELSEPVGPTNFQFRRHQGEFLLLEVNPRMSYQFADLYQRVDGKNPYQVQLEIAMGTPVRWQPGAGPDRAAASFVMRRFSNGQVVSVPSSVEVEPLETLHPGLIVHVLCQPGARLSDYDQDVGSFRYAIINLSARNVDELHARYQQVVQALPFQFSN